MVIERRKKKQNKGYAITNNIKKVKYNFDISMLGILCQYVLSENQSIRRGHLTNLRNVLAIMDDEVYHTDVERKNMLDFIKRGLEIRLKLDIKDRRLILAHILGGIDKVTEEELKLYEELSSSELQYINDTVAGILSTYEMEYSIEQMNEFIARYKAQDYKFKTEMTEEFKSSISKINSGFRKIDNMNVIDMAFSTDISRMENDFSTVYDRLTSPNRFLRTQMQGFNQLLGGGLECGRFYLLLGAGAVGKSLFMLNIAIQIKKEMAKYIKAKDPTKKPTILFITQENTLEETVDRLFQIITGIKISEDMSKEEAYRLLLEDKEFSIDAGNIILHIIYRPDRSIDTSDLYNIIEDLEDDGYEIICLFQDHIKRIRSAFGIQDIRLELGSVVNEMKNLAILKAIPVVSVSHLNRDANRLIDENVTSNKYDLTRLLGRSNVGESLLMIDNSDAVFILGKEYDQDGNCYVGVNPIKLRYAEISLGYICLPYDKRNRIRLLTDMGLMTPIYKTTLRPDTALPKMVNGSLMSKQTTIADNMQAIDNIDEEPSIFDILDNKNNIEIFSSSSTIPISIKEGTLSELDNPSNMIYLVSRI